MLQVLGKIPKSGRHRKEIKTELKSAYSESGRRAKRLLRTENINDLTSGTSVKKHLSFVSLNEFPSTCSSSHLTPSSSPLPRLTISPIGKPQGCLFDNGTFSLVRSAFATPFATSSPKIKQTNLQKTETATKVVIEYPSKTVNKTLSGDMEPIVKAFAHGSTLKNCKNSSKMQDFENGNHLSRSTHRCIRDESTLFKEKSIDPQKNKQRLRNEWKEHAPVFYSFLLTCSSSKNTSTTANWFPSIEVTGSFLFKQRNSHMNASSSALGILIKTGSIEVIFCRS